MYIWVKTTLCIYKCVFEMWRCCSRTDIEICSQNCLVSVHLTAATGRRFQCDIFLEKNEYLYESLVVCRIL